MPRPVGLDDSSPTLIVTHLQMVRIPAGPFLMGSPDQEYQSNPYEKPLHMVELPEFFIGRYPVTNAEYRTFVRQTGHKTPRHWQGGQSPVRKDNHPVVYVSWEDALAYCRWLSKHSRHTYRLPTEAEWEKAAKGPSGHIYPWGDDPYHLKPANVADAAQHTTPIGYYSPNSDSFYGLADMVGNIWQWTGSLWGKSPEAPDFAYPYDPRDGREDVEAKGFRILRGGPFDFKGRAVPCTTRVKDLPLSRFKTYGFRVASSAT